MFARRHRAPGSSRERFRSSAATTPQPHRGGAAGRSRAAAALLTDHFADRFVDRPRVTVLSLASLASSLVGVAALAVGGLVTVALVF